MRYLLVGNYGVGNLGDELLREYFLKEYMEVEWTVVTESKKHNAKSNTVPRLPFGLHSFAMTPWWNTVSALRQSDGIVFGGGTLFTDIESVKAPLLWWWHAVWAWIFGKKIILAFQGIGPFRTRLGEWCSRWVVAHAAMAIVRDATSHRRISQWKNKKCIQSFDPVLSVFHAAKVHDRSQKLFIIIPRGNASESFIASARELYQKKRDACSVRILSLHPKHPREQELCRRLSQEFEAEVLTSMTGDQLAEALKDAAYVVTQRYHGAIAALGMDIPFIAIPQNAGDKLAAIAGIHRDDAMRLLKEGEAALRGALHAKG